MLINHFEYYYSIDIYNIYKWYTKKNQQKRIQQEIKTI